MGVDPNNIFGLFDSGSEQPEPGRKTGMEKSIEISDHPLILMGMFTRMVLRGEEINKDIMKFFQEIDRPVTKAEQEEFNKFMVFTRALHFLYQLDLENDFHIEVLLAKGDQDFLDACQQVIDFFSTREEYERCASVKKYQDFINFSKKKLPL